MNTLDDVVVTLTNGTVQVQSRHDHNEVNSPDVLSDIAVLLRYVPDLVELVMTRGVVIVGDLYAGLYSSAKFAVMTHHDFYGGGFGGDRKPLAAMSYWGSDRSRTVGRGETALDAAHDFMHRAMREGWVS